MNDIVKCVLKSCRILTMACRSLLVAVILFGGRTAGFEPKAIFKQLGEIDS
jgi:hypothetical protein